MTKQVRLFHWTARRYVSCLLFAFGTNHDSINDDRIFVYRHSGERYTDCRYDPCSPNSSPSALCLLLGMHVTPRADKISHGLCLFLRYLYTFTMIPLFALLAPDHELPSIWLPTNTIKLTPVDL
jgi:hypothetical protein